MTESHINKEEILDRESLELLGSAAAGTPIPSERRAKLRDRVLQQVDEELALLSPYVTIRAQEGAWVELEPLLEKKVLNVDRETGIESYLLRLHPGATPAKHQHSGDELCIVLEGEVSFDDIHLVTGDYHLARKGSGHGRASSVHGALLFLQSTVAAPQAYR